MVVSGTNKIQYVLNILRVVSCRVMSVELNMIINEIEQIELASSVSTS